MLLKYGNLLLRIIFVTEERREILLDLLGERSSRRKQPTKNGKPYKYMETIFSKQIGL
jgi:hypothetical protein